MDSEQIPFDLADRGEEFAELAPERPSMHSREEHGPCLFLGDAGERCSGRALEDGFCADHADGQVTHRILTPSRVVGASITIIVLVWPYVADLVREIVHWLASP